MTLHIIGKFKWIDVEARRIRCQGTTGLGVLFLALPIYIVVTLIIITFCSPVSAQGHPNEQWRRTLLMGKLLKLPDRLSSRERTIPAAWVIEAVKKTKDVRIENAMIEGKLSFRNQTFAGEFHLESCEVNEEADFSHAHFNRGVRMQRSTFHKKVDFTGLLADENVFLLQDDFMDEVFFADADIKGALVCGDPDDETKSTRFRGYVDIKGARIDRRLDMSYSIFEYFPQGEDKASASFNDLSVGGYASFYSSLFCGPVRFDRAQVRGTAYFSRAIFEDEAHFPLIEVGNGYFHGATFAEKVSFKNSSFKRGLIFAPSEGHRCIFMGPADFSFMVVGGEVRFDRAGFEREAIFDFVDAKVMSFRKCRFKHEKSCQADHRCFTFRSARFDLIDFGDELAQSGLKLIDLGNCEYRRIQFGEVQQPSSVRVKVRSQESWGDNLRFLTSRFSPIQMEPYTQLEKVLRDIGYPELADDVYYEGRKKLGNQHSFLSWAGLQDRFLRFLVGYGVINHRIVYWLLILIGLGILVLRQNDALEPKDRDRCPTHGQSCKQEEEDHPVGGIELFWVVLEILLPLIDVIAGERWIPRNEKIKNIDQGCREFTKSWAIQSLWRSLYSPVNDHWRWIQQNRWRLLLLPFLIVRALGLLICGVFLSVIWIPLMLVLILMKVIRTSPTYSGFATLLKVVGWIIVPVGIAALTGFLQH